MEYESAQQMAERLGVTVRAVQKWAKEGKLPGAKQLSRSWLIPTDLTGPVEPKPIFTYHTVMPLLNSSFTPGGCLAHLESIQDPDDQSIATGEYYYFTAQPERAAKEVELYLNHPDFGLSLSACTVYFLANRVLGKTHLAHYALERAHAVITSALNKTDDPHVLALAVYFRTFSSTTLRAAKAQDIPLEQVMRYLPDGLKLFATYLVAYRHHRLEEHARSLGMVDTALSLFEQPYPLAEICLLMIAAIDMMSLKRVDEAKNCFKRAWNTAKPDYLIEMFGEHYNLLQGVSESCLRHDDPDAFKHVIEITKKLSESWRRMRNAETDDHASDTLLPTEFTVATLVNRGWSIRAIAEHLELSERMVKYHISCIYQKLDITNREELRQYMTK